MSGIQSTYLSVLILLSLAVCACGAVGGEVGYQPPLVPLHISVDTWGQIRFTLERDIQVPTPLGVFDAGIIIDPGEYFQGKKVLIVRFNGQDHVYDLHGRDFEVKFESGYYEQITLKKTGNQILLILDATTFAPGAMKVYASRPADASEGRAYPSIWNGITFANLKSPGTHTYRTTISPSVQRWAFTWCGKDPHHFASILKPFTIGFYIDGVRVNSSSILQYDTNGICRNWMILLDGWVSGSTVTLDIRYHLSAPIEGGTGKRDIGDYTQRIIVSVR